MNLNWFYSAGLRVKPRNAAEDGKGEKKECSPHFFSYPDGEGKMRGVKVEGKEHAEVLATMFEEGVEECECLSFSLVGLCVGGTGG